jgi:hypothetical protein
MSHLFPPGQYHSNQIVSISPQGPRNNMINHDNNHTVINSTLTPMLNIQPDLPAQSYLSYSHNTYSPATDIQSNQHHELSLVPSMQSTKLPPTAYQHITQQ